MLYAFAVITGLASCLAVQQFAHIMQQESGPAASPAVASHLAEATPLIAPVENDLADESGTHENTDSSKDSVTMSSWFIVLAIVSTIYGVGFIGSSLTLYAGTSIAGGLIFTWFLLWSYGSLDGSFGNPLV